MKPIILGVAAFMVGTGVGTGVVVMRAPAKASAKTQAATHDSTQATAAAKDVKDAKPAPGANAAAASQTDAAPKANGAAITALPASNPPPPVLAGTPAAGTLATGAPLVAARIPEDFTQVSRILTNMKPAEAAKIMSYLNDDQVEGIVRAI